ncbi:hypothetical protein QE152_g4983 [Popillia japonica]|uniref:Uncharacterized protein n=1 Tax=Popillia japonica TaxID=7064 RepID=A0AAW1N0I5_POPJA
MYEEYRKWGQTNRVVSRKVYETIFKTMNIKIKSPHKDTCQTCDKLNMLIKVTKDHETEKTTKMELTKHQDEAEDADESKIRDKKMATECKTKLIYTFDLQQCLLTLAIVTYVSFYKRPLWTFNITLHRCNDSSSFNMMWHEAISGRGANNIASCLFKHFTEIMSPEVEHVILYSDTYSGQNTKLACCYKN